MKLKYFKFYIGISLGLSARFMNKNVKFGRVQKTVGMLIPGKLHPRAESCNFWVSNETSDFARVQHTFYRRDRSSITGGGMNREGTIAGQSPMRF